MKTLLKWASILGVCFVMFASVSSHAWDHDDHWHGGHGWWGPGPVIPIPVPAYPGYPVYPVYPYPATPVYPPPVSAVGGVCRSGNWYCTPGGVAPIGTPCYCTVPFSFQGIVTAY